MRHERMFHGFYWPAIFLETHASPPLLRRQGEWRDGATMKADSALEYSH
jgi:hypothetical protein